MKLNTKLLGIILLILVILIGGGIMVFGKNTKTETKEENPQASVTKSAPEQSNSLLNILSMGKTQKCEFSTKAEAGGSTNGTIYLSASKMRGDITTTTSNNKVTKINMIRDGDTTYIWGSDLPQGIKMTVSQKDLENNPQANQYFDTKQNNGYKCTAWIADNSVFTAPTNIKFTDMSAFQNLGKVSPAATTPGESQNSQCSVCNNLPGEAKTACLTQLNCK